MPNENLYIAKRMKNDEFYTRYEDIALELGNYRDSFNGKIVYLNCDNPVTSNFYRYFVDMFDELQIRELWVTYLAYDNNGYVTKYNGKETIKKPLIGNGDFRSDECIAYLQEVDIIVTNPPFSQFLNFFNALINSGKDFLIIGNFNSILCHDVFPLIKNGTVSCGINKPKLFLIPDDYEAKNIRIIDDTRYAVFGNICWYTTLKTSVKDIPIYLSESYSQERYPKYDNYDAIEVSRISLIPNDYYGIMGVPITYIEHHCPNQFEILWEASGNTRKSCPSNILKELKYKLMKDDKGGAPLIDGKRKYSRIMIRRIH